MKQNNFYESIIGNCDLQKTLLNLKEKNNPHLEEKILKYSDIPNLDKYIILPEHKHNDYAYPDLLVPIGRTHLGESWNQAHNSLKQENSLMLTIRQFIDFLSLLKSGNAYDGNGKKIDPRILAQIFNDIKRSKNSCRTECLDSKFTVELEYQWYITYHKINPGHIIQEVTEPLENHLIGSRFLMKSNYVDLFSANKQGLPTKKTMNKNFHYLPPENGSVAVFITSWDYSGLSCRKDPDSIHNGVGVRAVKIKK